MVAPNLPRARSYNLAPNTTQQCKSYGEFVLAKCNLASVGNLFGDGLSHKHGVRVGRQCYTYSSCSLIHFRCIILELYARTLPGVNVCIVFVITTSPSGLCVEAVPASKVGARGSRSARALWRIWGLLPTGKLSHKMY